MRKENGNGNGRPKVQLFEPGRVVTTPGALDLFERTGEDMVVYLARHLTGDWGRTLDPHDVKANNDAVK